APGPRAPAGPAHPGSPWHRNRKPLRRATTGSARSPTSRRHRSRPYVPGAAPGGAWPARREPPSPDPRSPARRPQHDPRDLVGGVAVTGTGGGAAHLGNACRIREQRYHLIDHILRGQFRVTDDSATTGGDHGPGIEFLFAVSVW